jgi:hypothetical protein
MYSLLGTMAEKMMKSTDLIRDETDNARPSTNFLS